MEWRQAQYLYRYNISWVSFEPNLNILCKIIGATGLEFQ